VADRERMALTTHKRDATRDCGRPARIGPAGVVGQQLTGSAVEQAQVGVEVEYAIGQLRPGLFQRQWRVTDRGRQPVGLRVGEGEASVRSSEIDSAASRSHGESRPRGAPASDR
jgi:hypothetical protein